MKNNRRISAFSLIEISIVILIIGILVAGVTQSSRLISQAKLSGAKSMTQSAPVSSIKNLALWIESTSDASFQSSDLDDGTAITTWNDINPQATLKASFTVTNSPIYKKNLINGLPAVCFNSNANCGFGGTTSFLSSANFSNLSAGSTVFAVVKLPNTLAAEPILSKRIVASAFSAANSTNLQLNTTATGDWQYCDGTTQSGNNVTCSFTSNGTGLTAAAAKGNYVVSVVYNTSSSSINSTTTTGITFFQNGLFGGTAASGSTSSPSIGVTDPLLVGKTSTSDAAVYFKGYIGEIIVFDRALKREERQSIEDYLGNKWGITMTTAAI